MEKKTGLVICYFHVNYGSMLQAYATQYFFDKMGLPNEAVYCSNPHMYMTMPKTEYYFHKLTNRELLADKLKRTAGGVLQRLEDRESVRRQRERELKFRQFSEEHFRVSKPYRNRSELENSAEKYSLFVVGSDQLWSPANIDNDFYTLTFVPDHIPKIAYATSFGTSSLPKYQHRKAREFLERFDAVSVREDSGKRLVEQLSEKKASVVVDPTLLLERADWEALGHDKPLIREKYIFCYFLGNNRKNREFALRLKRQTGYRIAAILHMDEYVRGDKNFADITPYRAGPAEFVNLIRYAEYVCTDSFHGTVFSVIFGKKFFTFNRFHSGSSISTNSRIDTLLSMLSLEERRKTGEEEIRKCMAQEIDYDSVYKKLDRRRKESIVFLKNALRDTGCCVRIEEGEKNEK